MSTDKRFQVFVSSTYLDLREERQAVTSALLQLDAFPSGMELFPVADDDAWTLIKRVIDDCDYYLLVIGGKYGSIDPVDEISYTEKEYDYATSQGKPVLAFLHADPDQIPSGKTDRSPEAAEKLNAFRTKVRRAKHVKFWNNAEHLAGLVALSFAQFTRQYPAVGWIRADQVSPELLGELNLLRKRVAQLEKELEVSQTGPPQGTDGLAQGSDDADLMVNVKANWRKNAFPNEAFRYSKWVSANVTWDDIVAALSPRLLDECEEGQLHDYLDNWLLTTIWVDQDHEKEYRTALESAGQRESEGQLKEASATTTDDDFGTVLIQMVALGLLEKSTKRRSVSDSGTYWTLTRYGQTRAIQLRAKRSEAQ